jgi:hypothetical protein
MNYNDKVVKFGYTHNQTTERENCQLFVAMTGSKQFLMARLQELLLECQSSYGKPKQGRISHGNGSIDIITPKWGGKDY